MDIEKLVISKALKKNGAFLQAFINKGIGSKHFKNKNNQEIYNYIVKTNKEQGALPTSQEIQTLFKLVAVDTTQYRVEFLIEQFQAYYARTTMVEHLASVAKIMETDPMSAHAELRKGVRDFASEFSVAYDVDLSDSVPEVLQHCKDTLAKGGVSGIKTPWEPLNKAVGGLNPEDFILITGRPKSGKSWEALYMASHCVQQGMTVLLVSKEMSKRAMQTRYIGIRAKVPYTELKTGALTTQSKIKLGRLSLEMKQEKGKLILVQDDTSASSGIIFIDSKVEEHKPDVVFIDGVYLLSDDNGAVEERTRLRNISRDCKRMASRRKIPVVAVLQTNRDKVSKTTGEGGAGAIYGTDGFLQDTDWAIEIIKNKDLHEEGCRLIKVIAAREGEEIAMKTPFDLNKYNFNDIYDTTGGDTGDVEETGETLR